jgi:uncharacterized membrane protein
MSILAKDALRKKLERMTERYADDVVRRWEEYFNEPAKFHDESEEECIPDITDDFDDR